MTTEDIGEVVQLLCEGAGLTDGQLLETFIAHRDEAAFAALVRRHGPMVWGVCRRLLSHHDAEDAFQATFLVLLRKAASIVPKENVGNWLYGVARQTAMNARATAARRKAREKQVSEMPEPVVARHDSLDEELARLPDKYRTVLVLCELEGRTRKEVARELGLPEGTVASRLVRAKAMLARRLTRHGLTVSAGSLAAMRSANGASACRPATIKAASSLAAGPAATSVRVAALTDEVLKAMWLKKLKMLTVVLLVLGLSSFACVWAVGQARDNAEPEQKKEARPAAAPAAGVDRIQAGDRLRIQATNTLPDQSINGVFRVEPSGKVALGVTYGRVHVKGQTLEEAEVTVRDHLRKMLKSTDVAVTRYDPLAEEQVLDLERRVRQLEEEVKRLRAIVEKKGR
jgi:RNA polymerase sigma factor (sigma-70 family)